MRLRSIQLSNFRGYTAPTNILLSDFTAILGRNDVGKSTILEALEIFFNREIVEPDKSDPSVYGDSTAFEITCVFSDLPSEIVVDVRSKTTLQKEYLLNPDGFLEIVKRFDCRSKVTEEIFVQAVYPTHEHLKDLLSLKNEELKVRASLVGADISKIDQRSNTDLRQAIRGAVSDIKVELQRLQLSAEDGKKVFDKLQREFPVYALFQADRASKDDDREVADPMKVAVGAAVKTVEAELEAIKEKVRSHVMDVAQRTLDKLREMDPALAKDLKAQFKSEPKWDGFKLSLMGDNNIPINKRGSGVRRLILLNFFRAEAERRRATNSTQDIIFAIEEPESSQHPNNQILLIKSLLQLAAERGSQVIVTTHVPSIAALIPTDSVRFISRNEDGNARILSGTDEVFSIAADSLGVLPDKRAQVAVFVEGPNDVEFLVRLSRKMRETDETIIDMESDRRIVFIPTGGGNLLHWVNKKYLINAGLAEIHIYDTDDPASPKYKRAVDQINGEGGRNIAFLTQKRELENYLHPDAISLALGITILVDDWNDVPMLVAEQVHLESGSPNAWIDVSPEVKEKKASAAKKRLNTLAMDCMTAAQLRERDHGSEFELWLSAIRDRLH